MAEINRIFIVYETGHVSLAKERSLNGDTIICFDYLLERDLLREDIKFISLRDLVADSSDIGDWWLLTHDISREWYRLPGMDFLSYEGIRISEAPEPLLQAYLARLFYYVRAFVSLKKAYPNSNFIIPQPFVREGPAQDCLAGFHPWAHIDAARIVGVRVLDNGSRHVSTYRFPRRTWKTYLQFFFNAVIGLAPRKQNKIYTSAYWNHFEPVADHLPDTEFIVWETKNFYKIPWNILWKHRMRFMRSHDAISLSEERYANKIASTHQKPWRVAREEVKKHLVSVRQDLEWEPLLEVFDAIVAYAPRVVADIRTLRRIMEKERPNIVLVMASVGGPQHYFFLMAKVAALLKIPTVELQHAGATIDPRSVFCRIETDYLLTYGQYVNEMHEKIGHSKERLIAIGSPRFDKYVNEREEGKQKGKEIFNKLGISLDKPILLVALPYSDTLPTAFDSYQVDTFFRMLREVQSNVKGLQVVFKCRTSRDVNIVGKHLQGIFENNFALTANEDIFPLLCASDFTICNNSTVIYQAMLAKRPLVLYPWKEFDTYHKQLYINAAPIPNTDKEAVEIITRMITDSSYRSKLLNQQEGFLGKYSFDGKSAERAAAFLRNLSVSSQKKPSIAISGS